MTTWTDICAEPTLQDLPYKIETNHFGKIMMSPATFWHGWEQSRIASLLEEHLPKGKGKVIIECPVQTSGGIRVPDLAWSSNALFKKHRGQSNFIHSPEICIEILSASNTREEMLEKQQLYYEKGAREVWLCDEEGNMEFFCAEETSPIPKSKFCPSFPKKIDLD